MPLFKVKIEGDITRWEVVVQNTNKDPKKVAKVLYSQYFTTSKKRIFIWEDGQLKFTYNGHNNETKEYP